jgi:hypothetical protein
MLIYQIGFIANLFHITIDNINVGVVIHVHIDGIIHKQQRSTSCLAR